MALKRAHRHSAAVINSNRWPALRQAAKRRDRFRCVSCGASGRLEVDHVLPVRTHPDRAFDLTNLQTLCVACHARKTRVEIGFPEVPPARRQWLELVRSMERKTVKGT